MAQNKFYAGVICGHGKRITEEDDSFLVEVAGDVVGDVCDKCFCECPNIHNADSAEFLHPYVVNGEWFTQYYYSGTIVELQRELGVLGRKWNYMIPTTNNLYSSWEYGTVEADSIEEATEKAKAKLREDFVKVNRAISNLGFRIDCDFDSVVITEEKDED